MRKFFCAGAVVLVLVSGSANAGLISGIGGAPSWPNWVGPTTIDFDTQTPGNFNATIIGNTKFIGVDGQMRISAAYINQYNTYGVQSLQSGVETNPITPHTIEFDFTNPVSAVAWDWGAADNAWLMSAYDSSNNFIESHIITLPFSGTDQGEYFGINSPDIKRIVLQDQLDNYPDGDFVFIDDFTTSPTTAPEPMLLAPIVFAAALLRRRAGRN